jgi:hypothetical protein
MFRAISRRTIPNSVTESQEMCHVSRLAVEQFCKRGRFCCEVIEDPMMRSHKVHAKCDCFGAKKAERPLRRNQRNSVRFSSTSLQRAFFRAGKHDVSRQLLC